MKNFTGNPHMGHIENLQPNLPRPMETNLLLKALLHEQRAANLLAAADTLEKTRTVNVDQLIQAATLRGEAYQALGIEPAGTEEYLAAGLNVN